MRVKNSPRLFFYRCVIKKQFISMAVARDGPHGLKNNLSLWPRPGDWPDGLKNSLRLFFILYHAQDAVTRQKV